jgi:hypothetical protein
MAVRVPEKVRRVLVACGGVAVFALLLAATVAALVPRPTPPPVQPGYALIRDGMTEPEVEALLGGPRGVYGPGVRSHFKVITAYGFGPGGHCSVWHFPGYEITITFDAGGRVCAKRVSPPPPAAAQAWQWAAERWQP